MEKGVQQGEAAMLIWQLQRRFGLLAKAYEQRILQTGAETLLSIEVRILEMDTLEALFADDDIEITI